MTYTKEKTAEMFRDWFNNFLTVECFAEHYGIRKQTAEYIIKFGRIAHEQECKK
jgi:hypothetical protein